MNDKAQGREEVRNRAVERMTEILKGANTREEIEGFVDDVITAARLPQMTAHEAAVADLRRRQRDGVETVVDDHGNRAYQPAEKMGTGEGPVERMTNEGSIGTGPDRN